MLRRDFRHIDPAAARVILVEPGPKLLTGFADRLSASALRALRRMNVEVRLSTSVETIDGNGIGTPEGRIEAGVVIWCAGVRGSPPARRLGVPLTRQGTVPVNAQSFA